jgi:hypothetical protein
MATCTSPLDVRSPVFATTSLRWRPRASAESPLTSIPSIVRLTVRGDGLGEQALRGAEAPRGLLERQQPERLVAALLLGEPRLEIRGVRSRPLLLGVHPCPRLVSLGPLLPTDGRLLPRQAVSLRRLLVGLRGRRVALPAREPVSLRLLRPGLVKGVPSESLRLALPRLLDVRLEGSELGVRGREAPEAAQSLARELEPTPGEEPAGVVECRPCETLPLLRRVTEKFREIGAPRRARRESGERLERGLEIVSPQGRLHRRSRLLGGLLRPRPPRFRLDDRRAERVGGRPE